MRVFFVVLIVSIFLATWNAYILTCFWDWLVVPSCGFPALPFRAALAIALTLSLFQNTSGADASDASADDVVSSLLSGAGLAFVFGAAFLGLAKLLQLLTT